MSDYDAEKAKELAILRKQNSDLKVMNTRKDEFIGLASHQLRTPATAVKQYLSMVLEGYVGPLSNEQREFLQKAYDSNERQLGTINDLLQVAQIDADHVVLHYEQCDVVALLKSIVQEHRNIAKIRHQRIVFKAPPEPLIVWADVLRLRMAFDNIVDNASKYSGDSTTITITARAKDDYVIIRITDHGVGIATEDFPKLFQKFSRIDNERSILVGGNGLGLYLADKITRAHSGEIMVASGLGRGTTFAVQLPKQS